MEMNQVTTGKKRAVIGQEQLTVLMKSLEAAQPPARNLTVVEALQVLSSQLVDAKKRGHTAESIATVLKAQGLDVPARSITLALRKGAQRKVQLAPARKSSRAARAPVDQS